MVDFQKSDIAIFASITAVAISILALVVSLFGFKQQRKMTNSGVPGVNSTVNIGVSQESMVSESEISSSVPTPPMPLAMKRTRTKVLEKEENNSPNSLNVKISKLVDARQKLKRVPTKKVSQILNSGHNGITNSTLNNVKLKELKSTENAGDLQKNNSLNPHGVTNDMLANFNFKKVVVKKFSRKKSELDPNSLEGILASRRKKLEGESSILSEQISVSPIKRKKFSRKLSGLAQKVSEKIKVSDSNSEGNSSIWSDDSSYVQTDDSPKNGKSVGLYVSNNSEVPKKEMGYTPENNVPTDKVDNKIGNSENSNYDNLSDEAKKSIQTKINKMNLEEQ